MAAKKHSTPIRKNSRSSVLPDRFTTTPPSPFPSGTTVSVCFANPDLAGTTVTISIVSIDGQTQKLAIVLDAEGHGCATWVSPSWDGGTFEHPTSADHPFVIT